MATTPKCEPPPDFRRFRHSPPALSLNSALPAILDVWKCGLRLLVHGDGSANGLVPVAAGACVLEVILQAVQL
jgi:hypothetical protein